MTETLTNSVISIIDVTVDDMPLDCCDDSRVHVFVTSFGWSPRRAFLTQGEDILRAHLRHGGGSEAMIESVLTGHRSVLKSWADGLRGLDFYATFEAPDFEPESGERIELRDIRPTPPIEEVMARLHERQAAREGNGS